MKKGKNKRPSGREMAERRLLDRKIRESDNRKNLIAKLSPKAAEFARREFAKLGLY
jgi:hypothetical protein